MTVDFHAHVLPGVDHGSRHLETSLKQLQLAHEASVDTIIATPHFYPHKEALNDFLDRRLQSELLLRQHMDSAPHLLVGAEVFVCHGMERMDRLSQLCITGTNILLLEMPSSHWNEQLMETVVAIGEENGICVVLAHIDRYDPKPTEELLSYGILAQLNADSLLNSFHRRRLRRYIDAGSVVALGSDIHGTEPGYGPFLKVKKHLGLAFETVMDRTEGLLRECAQVGNSAVRE